MYNCSNPMESYGQNSETKTLYHLPQKGTVSRSPLWAGIFEPVFNIFKIFKMFFLICFVMFIFHIGAISLEMPLLMAFEISFLSGVSSSGFWLWCPCGAEYQYHSTAAKCSPSPWLTPARGELCWSVSATIGTGASDLHRVDLCVGTREAAWKVPL